MSEDKTFCVNSRIFDSTMMKRFVELMSGKGGLGSLLLWLDQLDFVEGLHELVNAISRKEMFYDSALMKCPKEALKRPEFMREEEIATMLGDVCVNADCNKYYSIIGNSPSQCRCGGRIESKYSLILDEFEKLDVNPIPEAVMMWAAYMELADAYVLSYQAIQKVLNTIITQRGWSSPLQFLDYELKDRLDYSFYYGEPGDMRIAKEEREILMILYRGPFASIGLVEAKALIERGIATVKFGYLFNQLFCAGADRQYDLNRVEFSLLYNKVNAKYRLETFVGRKEREKRFVDVLALEDKRYYACALLPKDYWIAGKLSRKIVLHPIDDLPIYSTYKDCAVNAAIANSGKGKSTLMATWVSEAFDRKHEVIVSILNDEANSLTLASLPLFPCKGRTGDLLSSLAVTGTKPHGIPNLTLTFMREGETIAKDNYEAHPPTIYDRIVEVKSGYSFGFKFENSGKAVKEGKESPGVLNILREIAVKMGYSEDAGGLINIRNLGRLEDEDNSNFDIRVATSMMDKFALWRENCKNPSARIFVDEASYVAPVTHSVAGSDTSKSSTTLSGTIKKVRKKNTSFDLGTQKWSEINTEARSEAFNIFFRELPQSQDKGRSQRDIVLDSLMLREGKSQREQVAGLMERGAFPDDEFWWFWWNKTSRDIQVVKPTVPYFMINQPKHTNREIFKAYEKLTEQKILLDSWRDVPILRYHDESYDNRPRFRGP